jgi:uncharacterized membrane protein
MNDSPRLRSLTKTLTWRILATTDTFIIAWLITGQIDWAAGIAGIEVITKMFLYYGHERAWNSIGWLKPKRKEEHTQIFPFRD